MAASLKLPYGLRDGQLVHIQEAANGLACACTCPGCGARLVARNQGRFKVAHFAHHQVPECSYGLQTALHLAAKDVFLKHRTFCLPGASGELKFTAAFWASFAFDAAAYQYRVPCEAYEENTYAFAARYVTVLAVLLERRTADIIPDIILETDNGPLMVEIAVTHFIDEVKREKIKHLGLPTIEIDLSKAPRNLPLPELERLLIHETAGKSWAYNAKLAAKLAGREAHYLETVRPHIEAAHRAELAYQQAVEREQQERVRRKAFYATQLKPIIQRELTAANPGTFVQHVDACPISPRSFLGRPYASVQADCRQCRYFRGYGAERKSVVCLYEYDNRKKLGLDSY